MTVEIIIVNKDQTETTYTSVNTMPNGPLKTEIQTILSFNTHNTGLTVIRKIMQ